MKCRKNTKSRNLKFVKTNKGKLLILSKFAVRDREKSRFMKEQESVRLLYGLEIKTPLIKLLLSGKILF